jgi:hypothetical protein
LLVEDRKDGKSLARLSPPLAEAIGIHNAIEKYVKGWLDAVYGSEGKAILKDEKLLKWYRAVRKLKFQSTFKEADFREEIEKLLMTWLFVSVYLHNEHGDEGEGLVSRISLRIPRKRFLKKSFESFESFESFKVESEVGKKVFEVIFLGVISEKYEVGREEWVRELKGKIGKIGKIGEIGKEDKMVRLVEEFQKDLMGVKVKSRLEIGINK